MIDDLLGFYSNELDYLRQMGAEFSRRYPQIAARLLLEEDKCGDPHVERLLEGVALLTARIRRKIDDEFPEITDALLGLIYPQFQRPWPSMAIVQFPHTGEPIQGAQSKSIPRDTRLKSRPVQGLECQFRTVYPVPLWPIEVSSARYEPSRLGLMGQATEAVATIQLTLRTVGGLPFNQLPLRAASPGDDSTKSRGIRFYLDGVGTTPYTLYELLLNDLSLIQVCTPRGDLSEVLFELNPSAIQPAGFDPMEGMLNFSPRAFPASDARNDGGDLEPVMQDSSARVFPGYRLLQEYFALPQKFRFFDLIGLDRLKQYSLGDSIVLNFFLKRTPRSDPVVVAENFRLRCTPVVNLFEVASVPISLTHTQFEYPVIPALGVEDMEVYSIGRVLSKGGMLADDLEYEPFYTLRHVEHRQTRGGAARRAAYWYATRRPPVDPDDPVTTVSIAFVDSAFDPHLPARSKVTVFATCTNRNLPSRLPPTDGRLEFEIVGPAPVTTARCLTRPTRSVPPPIGRGAQWRLISSLALNHLSLTDDLQGLHAFRELLETHNFSKSDTSLQLTSGIKYVSSERTSARIGQPGATAICRGIKVTVDFEERNYVGNSAFLLASVLDRFLSSYASINSFTRLLARSHQPKRIIKEWPARVGERTLV